MMIKDRSIFKAYDVRGIYPDDINQGSVDIIGKACAHLFAAGEVILAHDVRYGSPEMTAVLEKSILAEAAIIKKDISLRIVGLATTPMFYFLVNNFKASGGCMITASHNPKNYNGVKIVKEKATMVPGTELLAVIDTL